jgi:predicted nucleic acid-binding protein
VILADTNIWCDFLRKGDPLLDRLLAENQLIMHPLIIAELAMGHLPARSQTLRDLHQLFQLREASREDCLTMLERQQLYGRGIQWNDLQILTAVKLHPGAKLWTRDKRLKVIAEEFGVSFEA